jgi:hypothetical protein
MHVPTLGARALILVLLMVCGPASRVAAQAPPISEAHNQATLELLDAMGLETSIAQSMGTMMDMMMGANPQLEAVRPVFDTFFAKYFSWTELRDDFALLYASNFTESEILDLLTFYRTPTGAKAAVMLPTLMEQGGLIGERQVQEHLPELEQMIMDHLRLQSLPTVN